MANAWSRFFWSDWRGDPRLRACSLAARGLWMEMLCIAAESDRIGYVAIGQRPATATDLARQTGASESEVESLMEELARNGVFSRDRYGMIYSRRMVRDARASAEAKKNGKKGGNPTLSQHTEKEGKNPEGLTPPLTGALSPNPSPSPLPAGRTQAVETPPEPTEAGEDGGPPRCAPTGLAFAGRVIRLDWQAFARWAEAYRHVDLRAELESRDAWLSTLALDDRRRSGWFIATSNALAKRNTQAAVQRRHVDDGYDPDVIH